MKFTARSADQGAIDLFSRITSVVAKLSKGTVTVRIIQDRLFFIQNANLKENAHLLWVEILADTLFDDFRMEGLSDESNEIFLDVDAKELAALLHRSVNQARSLRIKLTKKDNCPHLSFEMKLHSATLDSRVLIHDLPVRVIAERFWEEYKEPPIPKTQVRICMPHLKCLQRLVGGLKSMVSNHHIKLSANNDGCLDLKVKGELVNASVHFKDLNNANPEVSVLLSDEEQRKCYQNVVVDGRTLHSFLSNQHLTMYKLVLGIVPERMAHFSIEQPEMKLQYFVPGLLI